MRMLTIRGIQSPVDANMLANIVTAKDIGT